MIPDGNLDVYIGVKSAQSGGYVDEYRDAFVYKSIFKWPVIFILILNLFLIVVVWFLFHNHILNCAIHLDLEGNKENMVLRELQREHKDFRIFWRDESEGVLSWATEVMVWQLR